MNAKVTAPLAALLLFVAATPAPAAPPAWVATSNGYATALLDVIGRHSPEEATGHGLQAFDANVNPMSLDNDHRFRADLVDERARLVAALATEKDPAVLEDLQILIHACDLRIEGIDLEERYLLDYNDVSGLIFGGEFQLLRDQVADGRRPTALVRLRKYTGLEPGTTPISELAKAKWEESLKTPGRLGPFRGEVEQKLSNTAAYVEGVRKLYAKYAIAGAGEVLQALATQMQDYDNWVRQNVLPHARDDFRLPPELYAHQLRTFGLGISPLDLIRKAELEFGEAQNELAALAPLVAKEHGFPETDYRGVIRELKKDQLSKEAIEPYYREVITQIEAAVRREHLISMPERPLAMRLASEAETAQQPAPHYLPPPLIQNTGEHGEFVLPLGTPPTEGKAAAAYDDFTFKAAAWTLTAHEGRPGHDLQFSSMVERGVSIARSVFAFNSVNVEGWALYAEAEFKPYEPLDGQMIALQLRLLRAARAILDPMLNLGMITVPRAHDILVQDVGLSEAFTHEELERFTFNSPGQATSYFYGYSRLMETRTQTALALGAKFNRQAFNDFVIGQGLLPPELLAAAVEKEFIPAQP
jgi:hypothetical protein